MAFNLLIHGIIGWLIAWSEIGNYYGWRYLMPLFLLVAGDAWWLPFLLAPPLPPGCPHNLHARAPTKHRGWDWAGWDPMGCNFVWICTPHLIYKKYKCFFFGCSMRSHEESRVFLIHHESTWYIMGIHVASCVLIIHSAHFWFPTENSWCAVGTHGESSILIVEHCFNSSIGAL